MMEETEFEGPNARVSFFVGIPSFKAGFTGPPATKSAPPVGTAGIGNCRAVPGRPERPIVPSMGTETRKGVWRATHQAAGSPCNLPDRPPGLHLGGGASIEPRPGVELAARLSRVRSVCGQLHAAPVVWVKQQVPPIQRTTRLQLAYTLSGIR